MIYRYRLGADKGFDYVSPALLNLLGYEPEELYEHPELLLNSTDPAGAAPDRDFYENLGPDTRPLVSRRRHRDGQMVWIETRAVPVLDDLGEVVAIEGISVDVTAVKDAEAELMHHASHDDLTGLANRTLFIDHVNLAMARRRGRGGSVAVLPCLDGFKVINDSLGHARGDEVLGRQARGFATQSGLPHGCPSRWGRVRGSRRRREKAGSGRPGRREGPRSVPEAIPLRHAVHPEHRQHRHRLLQ